MTDTITSARVRELGEKATGGFYEAHGSSVRHYPSTSPLEHPRLVASCHWNEDAALIAALCSEPARNRIATALDLLERVEAGDAWRALLKQCAATPERDHDKVRAVVMVRQEDLAATLAALVGEGK